MLGLPEAVHACLFDLDGVLTDTASVHTKAWKVMFDAFLQQRAEQTGEPFVPFDPVDDYLKYVDGKKREDGVRSFLASRGIELPDGDPDDSGDKDTVYGLGTRKNDAFQETLAERRRQGIRRLAPLPGKGGRRGSRYRGGVFQRQHPPGAGDHRARQVHPAARRRRDAARGTHRGQAGTRFVPARRPAAERRPPPKRRYSRTPFPGSPPDTRAISASSSASTGWARPTNYEATVPMSWSPTSPNCFRRHA